jgi:AraC-like DNA-binding protein
MREIVLNESRRNPIAGRHAEIGQSGLLRAMLDREELARLIAHAIPEDGTVEPLKGLRLNRASRLTGLAHGVAYPSFCVIAQGAKEIHLGIADAAPDRPYLSLRLDLDPALVASVMLEARMPAPRRDTGSARALDVSPLDADLLDAAVRLVRLVDGPPVESRVLLPLITREVVLRLLFGAQSARLRHDYDKPLRIETLAREFGMSPSGFHEHFKSVTAMSPM